MQVSSTRNLGRSQRLPCLVLLAAALGLRPVADLRVAAADSATADSKPEVAPPAEWVTPTAVPWFERVTRAETGEEQRWLLMERQYNAAENDAFCHTARRILTVSGIQNGATLSFDYYPSYQTLVLHWVNLRRGTNVLNRLDADKVRMIQRERELDEYLFSGKRSAVLILEDVRVGDVVDCAYSIRGANPVLAGRFSASFPVQFQPPVEHVVSRVLFPGERRLFARNHQCSVAAAISRSRGFVEYKWDFRQVPGLRAEDGLPAWYDPEPRVQLSEFQTWAEVNHWALSLFRDTSGLSPELAAKIRQWQQIANREDQVQTVLRFLQDEVRYFGVEIGANSHKPFAPAAVFGRRFGDCKDKVLLFVTVLRALGIEANAVLVNTDACGTLSEWQPDAVAFDHVIAQVRLGDRLYWLDPTAGYQRGPLAAHYLPNYGLGLVIHPQTVSLTAIPHMTGLPQTTASEYFVVRGKMEPADLKVVTVAEGRDAERLRAQFATTTRDEIEKTQLAHYSGIYSGIKKARPIAMSDDEQRNRVEVTETYTIERIWTRSDRDESCRCQFFPYAVDALLKKPVDTARAMPLGVPFPQHQISRTEVILPEIWPIKPQNKVITDPAFSFRMNIGASGRRLVMEYEYFSRADSVPAGRAAQYLQRLGEASQSLGSSLSW